MKIALLEPLRVSQPTIDKLALPLRKLGHDFIAYDSKAKTSEELFARSKACEVVMIANTPYPREVISRLTQTRLINVAFTGVDHVDMSACREKGIKVCNAAGYSNQAVAEQAIGMALSLYRHLNKSDQTIRLGNAFLGPMMGQEIKGKTVGIVGTGAIGLATARLFKAFGAQLLGYNRTQKTEALAMGMTYCSLDTLLAKSDIVSVHLPATVETKHLLDAHAFRRMKKSAIFLNLARGAIVDNYALACALNAGELAGAGIDVFETEPPLPDDYPLLSAHNCLLTPHTAYLTQEAMLHRAQIAFDKTLAYVEGKAVNYMLS